MSSKSPVRVDPFSNLDDFTPAPVARPKPEVEAVRKASEDNNFMSRAPAPRVMAAPAPAPKILPREQRRHRTGRNVQVNIKTTPETLKQLQRLSDANKWVFGETLARALEALEIASSKG